MKVLKEIKLRSGLVDLCDAIAFDEVPTPTAFPYSRRCQWAFDSRLL
jgi:hypothetical protein